MEFTVSLQCMWDKIHETETNRVIGYSYYSYPQSLQEDKPIVIIITWQRGFEETTAESKGGRTSCSVSTIIVLQLCFRLREKKTENIPLKRQFCPLYFVIKFSLITNGSQWLPLTTTMCISISLVSPVKLKGSLSALRG